MNETREWYNEGCQFLTAGSGKKKKFNVIIRYNLLAMAFEKFVMTILICHGILPDNHTFSDLLAGLDRVMTLDDTMKQTIIRLESAQDICSFTDCFRRDPDESELDIMKDMVKTFQGLAEQHCLKAAC